MTSQELGARLTAVNRRLSIARDGEKWADVAALEAERAALTRQVDAAKVAEAQAEHDAMLQAAAQHLANLQAQGEALQGRWLAWLNDLDACERRARALWAEFDAIRSAEARLRAEYSKATGGATLSLTVGNLTGAALAIKRDHAALKWFPCVGVLDD